MVLYFVGRIIMVEGALLLFPTLVGLYYGERITFSFLLIAALAFVLGRAMSIRKPKNTVFFAKEGFAAVALA